MSKDMKKNSKTKIKFSYDGQDYCLEYTADSLKKMERAGLKLAKLDDMILTAPEELFAGAFIENHASVPRKKRLEIFSALNGEDETEGENINDVLVRMMLEAYDAATAHTGNVAWRKE